MKFLAILLAMFVSRLLFSPHSRPFNPGAGATRDRLIIWVFLSLCLEWALWQNAGVGYGLPVLLLEVLLLGYWLGRSTPGNLLREYAALWRCGAYEGASRHAEAELGMHRHERADRPQRLHYRICQCYLQQLLVTLFVPLFWFWLAGIPGLLLAVLMQPQLELTRPSKLAYAVQWLPVRLLGFSFFIAGSGVGAWEALRRSSLQRNDIRWLFRIALGAVGDYAGSSGPAGNLAQRGADEMEALQRLSGRALLLWLLFIALMAVAGLETRIY
ncbi:hypothetical protein [Marinobacterium aestuariivivens]|uniref:Uncharacterized protein n=1 Tax=Marinobacterium aestuariivivens TaxID=1698799 RepID=A0ABW1ZWI7_9GAMM